jgi:hypothetical protein
MTDLERELTNQVHFLKLKIKAIQAAHILGSSACGKRYKNDCDICSIADCPSGDSTHYSKKGCNSCSPDLFGAQISGISELK